MVEKIVKRVGNSKAVFLDLEDCKRLGGVDLGDVLELEIKKKVPITNQI